MHEKSFPFHRISSKCSEYFCDFCIICIEDAQESETFVGKAFAISSKIRENCKGFVPHKICR